MIDCIYSKILRYLRTTEIKGEKFNKLGNDVIKIQTKICKRINLVMIKNEFLKKCRKDNLVPKSLYKGQHLQQGRQLLQRIIRQNVYFVKINSDLLQRNFLEEGFSKTQCSAIISEMNSIIENTETNRQIINKYTEKFNNLKNTERFKNTKKLNYKWPVYNLSNVTIPPKFVQILQQFDQNSSVLGKRFDNIAIKAEIDNLAELVDFEYIKSESSVNKREAAKETLRKSAYSFIKKAKYEKALEKHRKVFDLVDELKVFLEENSLVILAPDKGKGHCLVSEQIYENALEQHIKSNYEKVHIHSRDRLKFLKYRETKIRTTMMKLKKLGVFTDREYSASTHQQSSLTSHILTVKVHKHEFISETLHGDGIPISSTEYKCGEIPLKFRTISPLANASSSKMGKVLGENLLCLQNSDLRLTGIGEIVENIQLSLKNNPISGGEEMVSFDAVSMYDNISLELVKFCLEKRKLDFEERTGMKLYVDELIKIVELCYSEGIEYKGEIYKIKNGCPTGHSISSALQNIVLSTYEEEIYKKYINSGKLRMYHRWVDDTVCIVETECKDQLLKDLNNFDPTGKLKFTIEEASDQNGEKSIAFLDIKIKWHTTESTKFYWSTEVFRKKTTSKVMKPFSDFGPQSWKIGTLVWFLRRAITHSSEAIIMH